MQGAPTPTQAQLQSSAHQANEVGAPGIPQQVGQHNLEGLGSGASRRDHHILAGGGAGDRGPGRGQGSAEAEDRGEPQLRGVTGEGQGRPRLQAHLRLDSEVSLGIGFRERTKATIQGK